MSTPQKLAQCFRLPPEISKQLDELAGSSRIKSRIVVEALTNFFEQKGSDEIELRFAKRLDQQSRQLERIELHAITIIESVSLFIRYRLTADAKILPSDEQDRAIGRNRFEAFVTRVGKKLQSGRLTYSSWIKR